MAALMDITMMSALRVAAAPFLAARQGRAAGQHFSDDLNFHWPERIRLHDIGPGPVTLKQGLHGAGLEVGITSADHRHASPLRFRTGQSDGSHDRRPRSGTESREKRAVEGLPETLRTGRTVTGDEFGKNRLICEVILSGNSLQNLLDHFDGFQNDAILPHIDLQPKAASFTRTEYVPSWPEKGFVTLEDARAWVETFVGWYNEEHRHSDIRYVTPGQRHRGEDHALLAQRN
jgi:hypothetical protein